MNAIYTQRRIVNNIAIAAAVGATGLGLFWLAAILWTLLSNRIAALGVDSCTQMTPPPGSAGGLLNALYGSALMTLVGMPIGAPFGSLAGTYLAEYGRSSRVSEVIRFINDILLSAP